MSVKIGHARIDERGKATGGQSGDQNGKELRTQNWYNGGWGFLARPKNPLAAEWIAAACEAACSNDKIGYDQSGRNTLLAQAKAVNWDLLKITTPCECDCSSLVSCCVQASGIRIWNGGNAPTTRTLRKVLQESGQFEILTGSKYLISADGLQRGDILCKEGSHTVIVLSNGAGQPVYDSTTATPAQVIKSTYELPILQKGHEGRQVWAMQLLIMGHGGEAAKMIIECGGADGVFGSGTKNALMRFQREHKLDPDGICGPMSWAKLLGVG